MSEVLLVYSGTIGSILSHYIEKYFNVKVFEYSFDMYEILKEKYHDEVILAIVVSQNLSIEIFNALITHTSKKNIVWLCQDKNNFKNKETSVIRYLCDGVDEWVLFNKILDDYIGAYKKIDNE